MQDVIESALKEEGLQALAECAVSTDSALLHVEQGFSHAALVRGPWVGDK